jgi:hypothetical protein
MVERGVRTIVKLGDGTRYSKNGTPVYQKYIGLVVNLNK